MQRYNRTNFVSARVVMSLLTAMQAVVVSGIPEYIADRHGENWLRVAIKEIEGRLTFDFFARNGQEVGAQILQASFDWHNEERNEFSSLLVKVYTMTEHPATVVRPTVRLKVPSGLTSWRSPSGITMYGKWHRSWLFGARKFLVTHDGQGNELKVPYHMDTESRIYGTFQGVTA